MQLIPFRLSIDKKRRISQKLRKQMLSFPVNAFENKSVEFLQRFDANVDTFGNSSSFSRNSIKLK